jgi:hypothetical protein
MNRRWRNRIGFPWLLVALLASLSTPAVSQTSTALDLHGKPVDPLRVSNGKVVVFIFIRTDCPISNRYAPVVQKMGADYSAKASFWLIYPDKSELPENILRHLEQYGYRLPALRDPQHALVQLSQVEITPEAAVFDSSGHLVYHGRIDNWYEDFGRARPAPTTHELKDAIQAVLNGKPPAVAAAKSVGCYISDLK